MRNGILAIAALATLTGCGGAVVVVTGEPPAEAYDGPMQLPVNHADRASVLERSGAAGRALECTTAPYAGGSGDYESGLASVQDSASAALENFFAEEFLFQLPDEGYRVEREDDGRVLFSYDVDGYSKITFIAADSIRDFNDDQGWGVETWAQCDPSELPPAVAEDLGIQVWENADGNRAPVTTIVSFQGAEHCDWQDITFLTLGGERHGRQYLRDTDGELADLLSTTFDASDELPKDATDTGFRRDGRRLWLSADRSTAYLVAADDTTDVERWPGAEDPIGCA